jgi:hypothetical protein
MCRSGFVTFSPESLQEQSAVVLLLEEVLVSWSLAMHECNGHEDLCGSSHRSVIPYVHGRTELYFSSLVLPVWAWAFWPRICFQTPEKRCLPVLFIAQGRVVTMRHRARQVALRCLKPYTTSKVIIARSSKWCLVQRQQRGVVLSYRSAALNMDNAIVPSCRVVSPL